MDARGDPETLAGKGGNIGLAEVHGSLQIDLRVQEDVFDGILRHTSMIDAEDISGLPHSSVLEPGNSMSIDGECAAGVAGRDDAGSLDWVINSEGLAKTHSPPPISLLGIVFATHQGRVLKLGSPTLTVCVDMVDREILPRELAPTGSAHPVGGSVPDHPALLRSKATLRILSSEKATKNTAQDLFTLASLGDVIGHLRNCHQVFPI
jgi:hypothetical protein